MLDESIVRASRGNPPISVTARDRGGCSAAVRRFRAKLPASLATAMLRFPLDVRLRKGRVRLAALVRDLSAQTESLVWAEVVVR